MKFLIIFAVSVMVVEASNHVRLKRQNLLGSATVAPSGGGGLLSGGAINRLYNVANSLSGGPLPGQVGLDPQLVNALSSGLSGTTPGPTPVPPPTLILPSSPTISSVSQTAIDSLANALSALLNNNTISG